MASFSDDRDKYACPQTKIYRLEGPSGYEMVGYKVVFVANCLASLFIITSSGLEETYSNILI